MFGQRERATFIEPWQRESPTPKSQGPTGLDKVQVMLEHPRPRIAYCVDRIYLQSMQTAEERNIF